MIHARRLRVKNGRVEGPRGARARTPRSRRLNPTVGLLVVSHCAHVGRHLARNCKLRLLNIVQNKSRTFRRRRVSELDRSLGISSGE
jgi:hypothetical protein